MSDSHEPRATVAGLVAQREALERKRMKGALRLEFLHLVKELMERKGGDCTVGDVQQEALAIWHQRHPGAPVPM